MPTDVLAEESGTARYLVVHDALRRSIADGTLPIGASLPSEADLSRRFGVSRITVRHALQLLADDRLIRKAKARRAVVAAPAPPAGWVVQSLDDIATMVGDATLAIRSWRRERSAADARLFGLPAATPLPCLRGVLARRGRPYARSIIYFPPDVGGRLARADFDDPVVFRILRRVLGIRLAAVEVTLSATAANTADVAAVGGAAGGPVLLTQLRYRDEAGRLVEVAYSRGIADAPHFTTRLLAAPQAERA